jgi:hypothetical protein
MPAFFRKLLRVIENPTALAGPYPAGAPGRGERLHKRRDFGQCPGRTRSPAAAAPCGRDGGIQQTSHMDHGHG